MSRAQGCAGATQTFRHLLTTYLVPFQGCVIAETGQDGLDRFSLHAKSAFPPSMAVTQERRGLIGISKPLTGPQAWVLDSGDRPGWPWQDSFHAEYDATPDYRAFERGTDKRDHTQLFVGADRIQTLLGRRIDL